MTAAALATAAEPEAIAVEASPYASTWEHLADELRWLDRLLTLRLAERRRETTDDPLEPFKGLVLSEPEILRLLAVPAPRPGFTIEEAGAAAALAELAEEIGHRSQASAEQGFPLALSHLARTFHLSRFEERCVLLCLAPEVDRKYERLYAYLQDDVTRRKPTVGLALELLCGSPEEALAARAAFDPRAPLIQGRLIQVLDGSGGPSSLLSRSLKLDDRIVELLLGSSSPASALHDAAGPAMPATGAVSPVLRDRLGELIRAGLSRPGTGGLLLHLHGPYGSGKEELVRAVCSDLGVPLVQGDAGRMLAAPRSFAETAWLLAREAVLQPAALCICDFDRLHADDGGQDSEDKLGTLLAAVETYSRLTFLLGESPWKPAGRARDGFLSLPIARPDAAASCAVWESALVGQPLSEAVDVGALASRFRLTPGQIRDAVSHAGTLALWRAPDEGTITGADLAAACRAQAGTELSRVARKVEPRYLWDDIVLPPDSLEQLREICDQARHRHVVLGAWGFERRLSLGKGLNVLFSGPPGTGKTMAAEVLARELELDLYKVDLSRVVSKYIGETEKNLDRVFAAAESSNAILFFDEADALFGKRSEVRDAHDRYANVEISYLLQKMEEYAGISVLASNLRQHLDPAFLRRLGFAVHFPFPDEESRRRIWLGAWPAETPLAPDVDFAALAREHQMSGGNIKNVAVAAAFLAAAEASAVRHSHLLRATRRELQKLGKNVSVAALGGGAE